MKFGAITLIWTSPFDSSKLGYVQRVAELGFDVIECAIEAPNLVDAGALAAALEAAGIGATVSADCSHDRDVSSADRAVRQRGIEYLEHCVDVAERTGAPVVSGVLYTASGHRELPARHERQAELRRAVESLKEVAEYAGERGVGLAIEPLHRFATYAVNTAEQGLELCERVGPAMGLLLDTFHMNIEEKRLGDAIRLAGDRLYHFHASENDRGVPGSGHVPWNEVAAALREIDYRAVVSIESFDPGNPELAHSVSIWRPIFGSGDELARDGLAFLKKALAGAVHPEAGSATTEVQ